MLNRSPKKYISHLNYKDLVIIFSIWFFTAYFNYLSSSITFSYAPTLTGLFRLLFISAGRGIFWALILFYLISFYDSSFTEIGLNLKNLKKKIKPALFLILVFLILNLIFINLPLSFNPISDKYNPLYQITCSSHLIKSLTPLLITFFPCLLIAFSEQFLLNSILFETINNKLPTFLAFITAAVIFPVLFLNFNQGRIIQLIILALISIYLYLKTERSIITPALFSAGYYAINIFYIYGWDFLNF